MDQEPDSFKAAQDLIAQTVEAINQTAPAEPDTPHEVEEPDTSDDTTPPQQAPEPDDGEPIPLDLEQTTAPKTVPIDRYDNAVKAMTQAKMEAADLRRTIAGLEQQLTAMAARQAEQQQGQATGENDADTLEDMRQVFPEAVGAMEKQNQRLEKELAELRRIVTGQPQAAAAAQGNGTGDDGDLNAYWQEILAVHPDALSYPGDPTFAQWARTQSSSDQAILRGNGTAQQMIDLLHRFGDNQAHAPKPNANGDGHARKPASPERLQAASKAATPSFSKPASRNPTPANTGLDHLLNTRTEELTAEGAWQNSQELLKAAIQVGSRQ